MCLPTSAPPPPERGRPATKRVLWDGLAEEEEAEKQHEHDWRERRGPQQRRWNERLEVREQEAHLCGRESERNAE